MRTWTDSDIGGIAAALCSALLVAALTSPARAAEDRPNFVLLFADDVGYGDLSCYGHPTIETPNLDRMADNGVRLTSFYSAPVCVPARVQLMLGRYQPRTSVGGTGVGGNGGIPDSALTLAEGLKQAGYRTGMAGKWHLGYAKDRFLPVNQGFGSWLGLPYSNDMRKPWVNTDVPLWLYRGTEKIEHPVNQDTLTTRYTQKAVDFIQSSDDKPFFFYLAYSMAHLPVRTADRFRGQSRAGLYGDVMETIDWSVGRVLAALEKAGEAENTVVVFASDNGPWLNLPDRMLQAGNKPWHAGSPGPLRGSKGSTYEGGVRVPAIVRWPGTIPGRRVTAEMAATMDLYVTFLEAAGAETPDAPVDGHDLMPFLKGKTDESPRERFYYFRGNRLEALRKGPWKLRLRGEPQLFNLAIDTAERYNRAEDKPKVVRRLANQMQAFADKVGANVKELP